MKGGFMKKFKIFFIALILSMFYSSVHADTISSSWKKTYSKGGDCHIDFPTPPQLLEQSMNISEAGHKLLYDIYLAPFQNRGVFLLLIATYPASLKEGHETVGLEGLVNGIVGHHIDNELIFSNTVEFMGKPAINFLVQSGSNYFRGHAVMIGNKLYLIAMEGKKGDLDEQTFSRFMKSFRILQS